jgi:hypothetical protein
MILGGSVLRVFSPGTAQYLRPVLEGLGLDALASLRDEGMFREWFEAALNGVAGAILLQNADNPKVQPGYKWGHGTKVLNLFLREVVVNSRYFSEADAKRLEYWLHVPVDGIIMARLRDLGFQPQYWAIKELTREDFYHIQQALGEAAAKVGVPRVWFDDIWAWQ